MCYLYGSRISGDIIGNSLGLVNSDMTRGSFMPDASCGGCTQKYIVMFILYRHYIVLLNIQYI